MHEDRVITESGKKTKDQIFNAAVKLLLKDGYDKLTIKKICEVSGTSNGSFYHFFRNKDELLAHYYNLSAEKFIQAREEDIENASLYEQMMFCYRWYINYSAGHGVDFCLNFFTPKNRAIDPNYMHNAFYEMSRECLHKHKDEILEGGDADQIAHELCVLAKGIISDWCNSRGSYDIATATERMFSVYLKGVVATN